MLVFKASNKKAYFSERGHALSERVRARAKIIITRYIIDAEHQWDREKPEKVLSSIII